MELIQGLDQRVSKLSFFDIQLVKIANWCFALFVAKLVPEIMNVSEGILLAILIVVAIKPFYVAWLK